MRWIALLTLLLTPFAALSQAQPTPLSFQAQKLPDGIINRAYNATIQVMGGTPPLAYSVTKGKLPPGITLQASSGILGGKPVAPGSYTFTATVADATGTRISREFTIAVEGYLTIKWQHQPSLDGNTLSGSVEVANNSSDTYNLTFITVAVNEVGKAFALGYQHFDLAPQIRQTLPFSSSLPNGRYYVHVDAVAEIPERDVIRRAQLETQPAIVVNVNR